MRQRILGPDSQIWAGSDWNWSTHKDSGSLRKELIGADATPVELYYYSKTMNDVVTPEYVTKQNRGEIIMNPMDSTERTRFQGTARAQTYTYWDNTQFEQAEFNHSQTGNFDFYIRENWKSSSPAMLEQEEVSLLLDTNSRVYEKANTPAMETLVTLAELRKTVQLLQSLSERLINLPKKEFWADLKSGALDEYRRYKSSFKKGRVLRRHLRRGLDRSTRQWLEYRYGIRQLLFDYQSTLALIDELSRERRQRFVATSNATKTVTINPSVHNWDDDLYGIKAIVTGSHTATLRVTSGLLTQPRLGGLGHTISATGLLNLLPTIWELTKLSFVFDWIIDIGGWLTAISPNITYDVLGSWSTVEKRITTTHTGTLYAQPAGTAGIYRWLNNTQHMLVSSSIANGVVHSRDVLVTKKRIINPQRSIIPRVNPRFDVSKALDAVSLVTQTALRLF